MSREEMRVSYVYKSIAKAPQTVTISFPMPEIPLDEGPDTEDALMNDQIPDKRNYMNFKVRVDGQEIKARLVERALFRGKDISARLKRDNVPLLLAAHMQEEKIKPLPEAVKTSLVKEGLFEYSESSEFYSANWNYQVLFEWEQTFQSGPDQGRYFIPADRRQFGGLRRLLREGRRGEEILRRCRRCAPR